jgi:hypothetical protein
MSDLAAWHEELRSREQLRGSLWEKYVFSFPGLDPISPEQRGNGVPRALEVLERCRLLFEDAKARNLQPSWQSVRNHALVVWQLLAAEVAGWLTELPPFDLDASNASPLRIEELEEWEPLAYLNLFLASQCAGLPQDRQCLDPVALFLPRWLYIVLNSSITGLGEGEDETFITSRRAGRRREKLQSKMRLRALEHVAFLVGQGISKGVARKRVATAMKNVAPETLRDWEERECRRDYVDLDALLARARAAGELFVYRDFGNAEEPVVEYYQMPYPNIPLKTEWILKLLSTDEPLADFGERYAAEFGRRHRSRS